MFRFGPDRQQTVFAVRGLRSDGKEVWLVHRKTATGSERVFEPNRTVAELFVTQPTARHMLATVPPAARGNVAEVAIVSVTPVFEIGVVEKLATLAEG